VATGGCTSVGILRHFGYDRSAFEALAAKGEPALLQALSAPRYPDGGPASAETDYLHLQRDADGTITSASTAIFVRSSSHMVRCGGVRVRQLRVSCECARAVRVFVPGDYPAAARYSGGLEPPV
jgi:hypothetical protein